MYYKGILNAWHILCCLIFLIALKKVNSNYLAFLSLPRRLILAAHVSVNTVARKA